MSLVSGSYSYVNSVSSLSYLGHYPMEKHPAFVLGERVVGPVISAISSLLQKIQFPPMVVGQHAPCEWGKAKKVLMHQPGSEVEIGVYHARAALFEKLFNVSESIHEHKAFVGLLKKSGADVTTVAEVLLAGTDKAGSKELADLRKFGLGSLSYAYSNEFSKDEIEEHEQYRIDTVMQMPAEQLVKMIMERPTVHLKKTNTNTHLEATYSVTPVMNMYFLRDQMITTSKGVVLGKMNSSQRLPEVAIVQFVLDKMGIKPIYQITGDARLEGGDFIPAGKTAFIGQGLRTNSLAIEQLIAQDAFGDIKTLVVVKDLYKNQDQMHLDTYFNIIASDKAVLIDSRMKGGELELSTSADIYSRNKYGKFRLEDADVNFENYLTGAGFNLIPVKNDDQLRYGINFLTVESNTILAIDGVSQEYKDTLTARGVDATWMDFSALTSGFGAAHCTTQVLEREKCKAKELSSEL